MTRFSGRLASGPPRPDQIQQEAYSHEVISAGFWPGNGGYGAAAFYCYAAPVPEGLAGKPVRPGAWDSALGEFILKYDEVRAQRVAGRGADEFSGDDVRGGGGCGEVGSGGAGAAMMLGTVAEGGFACDNLNSEPCPTRKFSP